MSGDEGGLAFCKSFSRTRDKPRPVEDSRFFYHVSFRYDRSDSGDLDDLLHLAGLHSRSGAQAHNVVRAGCSDVVGCGRSDVLEGRQDWALKICGVDKGLPAP
jgi:hypothetical protein